jgi:hypothetical protein
MYMYADAGEFLNIGPSAHLASSYPKRHLIQSTNKAYPKPQAIPYLLRSDLELSSAHVDICFCYNVRRMYGRLLLRHKVIKPSARPPEDHLCLHLKTHPDSILARRCPVLDA